MIMTLATDTGYCPAVFATIIMVLSHKSTGGGSSQVFFVSYSDGLAEQSRRVRNGALPGCAGVGRQRMCQGATWRLGMSLPHRWVFRPLRRSSTLSRHSSTNIFPSCGGWLAVPPPAFPDWCVGRARILLVESVAKKVVRWRGSAVVAGCDHAS